MNKTLNAQVDINHYFESLFFRMDNTFKTIGKEALSQNEKNEICAAYFGFEDSLSMQNVFKELITAKITFNTTQANLIKGIDHVACGLRTYNFLRARKIDSDTAFEIKDMMVNYHQANSIDFAVFLPYKAIERRKRSLLYANNMSIHRSSYIKSIIMKALAEDKLNQWSGIDQYSFELCLANYFGFIDVVAMNQFFNSIYRFNIKLPADNQIGFYDKYSHRGVFGTSVKPLSKEAHISPRNREFFNFYAESKKLNISLYCLGFDQYIREKIS